MIEEIARLEITYFTCASSCLNGKMIDKCSNTDRQHLYNYRIGLLKQGLLMLIELLFMLSG